MVLPEGNTVLPEANTGEAAARHRWISTRRPEQEADLRVSRPGFREASTAAHRDSSTEARADRSGRPCRTAVPSLLANRNPRRFDELFEALATETRALVWELSPIARIGDVRAPIELASSPTDPFFPVEESLALATAGSDVRLTVSRALLHVRPRLRPGIVSVVALLDRTLRRAAESEPVPALRPSVA